MEIALVCAVFIAPVSLLGVRDYSEKLKVTKKEVAEYKETVGAWQEHCGQLEKHYKKKILIEKLKAIGKRKHPLDADDEPKEPTLH